MNLTSKRKAYFLLYAFLIVLSCVFIIMSEDIQNRVNDTLRVCAVSVVPSLFPFMVISSLLTQSAPSLFSAAPGIPFSKMPIPLCSRSFSDSFCGFPVGIVTTAGLKKRGLITRDEAERLSAVSNNADPLVRGRRVCLLGLTRHRDKAVSDPDDRIMDSCRLHPALKSRG